MGERKYPVGGFAPGWYLCRCASCGGQFMGDKRSRQCEPCGVMSQEERDRKRAAWVNAMTTEYGPPTTLDTPAPAPV